MNPSGVPSTTKSENTKSAIIAQCSGRAGVAPVVNKLLEFTNGAITCTVVDNMMSDVQLQLATRTLDFIFITHSDLEPGAEQTAGSRVTCFHNPNTGYVLAFLSARELIKLQRSLRTKAGVGLPTLVPCRDIHQAAAFILDVATQQEAKLSEVRDRYELWDS